MTVLVRLVFPDGEHVSPMPRVPCKGERVEGPDDHGTYMVTDVIYRFANGFYYEPTEVQVECRPT